jgi:hypothetical protein
MHDRHDAAPEHDFLLLLNKDAETQNRLSDVEAQQVKA